MLSKDWATSADVYKMMIFIAPLISRQRLVLASCACARTVLHLVPEGEHRPRIAIETAERWTRGEATLEEVQLAAANAANAAYAVDAAANAYYAANAAYAAAYAANAAAYVAYVADVADAADTAADAAYYAAVATDYAAYVAIANTIRSVIQTADVELLVQARTPEDLASAQEACAATGDLRLVLTDRFLECISGSPGAMLMHAAFGNVMGRE